MADRRLRDLERAYAAGDTTVLGQIYNVKLRQGQIPKEYLMILSMLGSPHNQQIISHQLPSGRSYAREIEDLLTAPDVPRRAIYALNLFLFSEIQKMWESYGGLEQGNYTIWSAKSYHQKYGEDVQEMILYFQNLGLDNLPKIDDLISLMNRIHRTFPDRALLLGPHLDCTDSVELMLFDIAAKFIYEALPGEGHQKTKDVVEFTIRYIGNRVGDPERLAIGESYLERGRMIFPTGETSSCESLHYPTWLPTTWNEFFGAFSALRHSFFRDRRRRGQLTMRNLVRSWVKDQILNS